MPWIPRGTYLCGEGGVQNYPYAGSVCTELAMCRNGGSRWCITMRGYESAERLSGTVSWSVPEL